MCLWFSDFSHVGTYNWDFFFLKYSTKVPKSRQCKIRWKFTSCHIFVQFQFVMVVAKVLREFAAGTSIHGFTFVVSPKSSSGTKIIWAILLVVALMYATLEMRNSVVGKYDYISKTMKFNQWLLMHTLQSHTGPVQG